MKKGRKLALFASSAMMLLSLVGCGGGSDKGKTTITVWTTFNDTYQAVITKAINRFESKYPQFKVNNVKQNGGYNDLKSMVVKGVSSGDYPDIVVAYPDSVADFIQTGKALNIQSYMESTKTIATMVDGKEVNTQIGWTSEDFEDIPTAYIDEGQNYAVPGTYSLPICKSTEAMFYNRSILINLNLSSYDDEINDGNPLDDEYLQNLTWDEMFNKLAPALFAYNDDAAVKILTPSADYEKTWALVGYDSDDNLFITLAQQYGLGYTSVNKQTGVGSIDFAEKNADKSFKGVSDGYMNLMKKFSKAYNHKYFTTKGVLGKNVNYVSTTGGMLFSIGSTGGVSYQFSANNPYDVGVAPIPQATNDSSYVINQGPSIAFMKRGKDAADIDQHALASWLFYKEWMAKDIHEDWVITTGYAPVRNSVAQSAGYLALCDVDKQQPATLEILKARCYKYIAQNVNNLFSSPVFYGSSKARTAVGGIMADIFNTATLPEDTAAADYATKMSAYEDKVTSIFRNAFNNAI